MRKICLLLFLAVSFSVYAQEPDFDLIEKIISNEKSAAANRMSFVESTNYGLTDVVYQRMEWEIDPSINYIKGSVSTHYKSLSQDLSEIEFDIHTDMIIDSVIQNKQSLSFNRNENKLIVTLQNSLTENQLDSVKIYYQGEPTSSGFGAFVKEEHNGTPIIWTLSEPYGAMEWWPCKQSLIDKIDSIDIIVTSPELYRTASNGILISETTENGKRKMHWKHSYPIATYLVAIAVTNYSGYSDFLDLNDGRQIEILNYVYPEDLITVKEKTPVTTEIMALFNDLVAEYPFANEKYGHAQFGWGGGMEHQTMSFMGNFEFGLISHELAHQWFGDYITLGSWQDIWLNEGFASYLTGLSYEHLLDGYWWPRWKEQNVERITSQPGGSVFVEDTTNISRIFDGRLSYSKGSYLLHMLRWIVGDEDFYSGLRNYYTDPKIANGFARTEQFINHMEIVADTSLTEFFSDWFYGEGFPVYSASFAQANPNSLQLTLSQTPSHQSVEFFEMPVPIRVYNIGQTDSTDFILNHSSNEQEFIVDPGFQVSELKIDPEYWLISKTSEIVHVPIVEAQDDIVVYPNPFKETVSIFIPHGQNIISTKLFSVSGKLVTEYYNNQTIFDWSHLSSGTYLLQVKTNSKLYREKIIKE